MSSYCGAKGTAPVILRSIEDFEHAASDFRSRVGVTDSKYLDPLTLLQKLKKFYGIGHLTLASLPGGIEGEYDDRERVIKFDESTLALANRGHERARMTVFHEISHAALRHQGKLNRDIAYAKSRYASLLDRQEREAQRLAPAILAPFKFISPADAPEEISFKFGISRHAASIRHDEFTNFARRQAGLPRPLPPVALDLIKSLSNDRGVISQNTREDVVCDCCRQRTMIRVGAKLLCLNCDGVQDPPE
jgi:hypothetical protein